MGIFNSKEDSTSNIKYVYNKSSSAYSPTPSSSYGNQSFSSYSSPSTQRPSYSSSTQVPSQNVNVTNRRIAPSAPPLSVINRRITPSAPPRRITLSAPPLSVITKTSSPNVSQRNANTVFSSSSTVNSGPILNNTNAVTSTSFISSNAIKQSNDATPARRVVRHDVNNYIIPDSKVNVQNMRTLNQSFMRVKCDRFVMRCCPQYISKTGCSIEFCYRFHVCQFWIKGNCYKDNCSFAHSFQVPNNIEIYRALISRNFTEDSLREKLRRKFFGEKDVKSDLSEICCYFILNKCNKKDCKYYHFSSSYSWQLCLDGKWLPFPRNLNDEIERAFCNPENSTYTLQEKDKKNPKGRRSRQLDVILSQEINMDFENMTLSTSDQSFFRVRRLSTQSDIISFISVATRWLWYWQECNGSWVFYTNASVNNMVVLPFSDYIETQFLKRKNINLFTPLQTRFSYYIDFTSLTQTNEATSVSRKIRRRPMCRETFQWKENTTIRNLWSISPEAKIPFLRVPISSSSPEFVYVRTMISKTLTTTEIQLERIENIHLWNAYQLRKAQISKVYQNDFTAVNEQFMFHGTSKTVVDKICSENLDWRLYGTSVGNVYGKGTYFANSAEVSNNYSRKDDQGYKWMFVALVLIGTATVGNSDMIMPPMDPQTGRRFDSTVNDTFDPQIFVKYNLDDYYPAYVFKYKEKNIIF